MRDSEPEQTTAAEFDEALNHAERLLRTVRELRQTVSRLRVVQATATAVWILAGAVFLTRAATSPTEAVLFVVATALALAGIVLGVESLTIRPLMPRIRREERTMIELVDMLRELSSHLARREGWSDMRRFLVRIRLEQFSVGVSEDSR